MIGVSESLIRHVRRSSIDPTGNASEHQHRGIPRGNDTNDPNTKHAMIDNLLASSPPLPAPPIMQPAQIQAQERELEMQMSRMHLQRGANQHRASVTALTIDPAYAVPAVQPPTTSGLSSALKARGVVTAAAPSAATSDWFAKVAVAPRPVAAVASFVPSSLAAALTDSGMLYKSKDEFARVSTREIRENPSSSSSSAVSDTIIIFLHPYSDVQVRPAKIRLQLPSPNAITPGAEAPANRNPTTEEVLANLLHKWTSGELRQNFGLRAALQPSANAPDKWSLRMVDEDTVGDDGGDSDDEADESSSRPAGEGSSRMASGEEVGMPEEDLPPLERQKPVRMFGVNTLAMTVADGCEHKMPVSAVNSPPSLSVSPASPTSAGTNSSGGPTTPTHNPSSRNPASSMASPSTPATGGAGRPEIRRYDTMRLTPTHATASATSPSAAKSRAVSIFSNAGVLPRPENPNAQLAADERTSTSQHAMSHDPSRMSVFGDPLSPHQATNREPKFYLKIHIGDHESHILGLLKSQLLADALPLLSTKKHALVAMKAEHYRFTYVDPLLRSQNDQLKDMTKILIGQLQSDELNLIPKLGSGMNSGNESNNITPSLLSSNDSTSPSSSSSLTNAHHGGHHGGSITASSEAPSLSSFQFSLDTASNYCEYKVIKTNQRGKRQHRIFGMDRYKIYNKTQSGESEGESGGMFSFIQRRISSDQGVSRAVRLINTIASVHVVSLRPTCFCINFKSDGRKDSPIVQSREYETETKMECAEVVAKLRFLMSHCVYEPPAGASLAGGGLLAQSIK